MADAAAAAAAQTAMANAIATLATHTANPPTIPEIVQPPDIADCQVVDGVVAPLGQMTRKLYDLLLTEPAITASHRGYLAQNGIATERDYWQVGESKDAARDYIAKMAGILKQRDGMFPAAQSMATSKMMGLWRSINLHYDPSAEKDTEVSARQVNRNWELAANAVGYELEEYFRASKRNVKQITSTLTTKKYEWPPLVSIKCEMTDPHVPDHQPQIGADDSDDPDLHFNGVMKDGSLHAKKKVKTQTPPQWRRAMDLRHRNIMTIGNALFPPKKVMVGLPPVEKLKLWYSQGTLDFIINRYTRIVFDAAPSHRLDIKLAMEAEREFMEHQNRHMIKDECTFDEAFYDKGGKDLFTKIVNYTVNAPKVDYVAMEARIRKSVAAELSVKKPRNDPPPAPRDPPPTPRETPGDRRKKGKDRDRSGRVRTEPGKADSMGRVKCEGKPFYASLEGTEYCIEYQWGRKCKCNGKKWHICNVVGCNKAHKKGVCRAENHKGTALMEY